MTDWLPAIIIFAILALFISNFSALQRSSKKPLRKEGLNDLKETLPRSHKKSRQTPNKKD